VGFPTQITEKFVLSWRKTKY